MAAKMSLCTISYNYEHYAGIDVEKLSNIINEYVKKEFADFNPQVSEPGSDMEMPDHVDMQLCKKDGSIFYESDILRRASTASGCSCHLQARSFRNRRAGGEKAFTLSEIQGEHLLSASFHHNSGEGAYDGSDGWCASDARHGCCCSSGTVLYWHQ